MQHPGINTASQLQNKLDSFIRKYYVNQLIRGAIYFASIALGSFILLVLLEHFGQFNSSIRTILFFSFVGATVFIFLKYILFTLLKLFSIGRLISHKQAAKIIGEHFPEVSDKLENLIQLQATENSPSKALLEASIKQKTKEISPVPFRLAINFGENKKYGKYLIAPLFILIGLLLFSPRLISDSTTRLVSYSVEFTPEAPFQFKLLNEKFEAYKDEDFTFRVAMTGEELPSQVKIQLGAESFLMQKVSKSEYSFTFKNLQRDREFYLKANEFSSKNFYLKVIPKPAVLDFKAKIRYPAYLNKNELVQENSGELTVPEGSHVSWSFKTKHAEEMYFLMGDSSYSLIPVAENEFRYKSYVHENTDYALTVNNSQVDGMDTLYYSISVIPDQRPSIELNIELDSSLMNRIYFTGLVKDDYGFSRLVFHSTVLSKAGKRGMDKQQVIPINSHLPLSDFYHQISLQDYALEENESIEYYFEIWDNDGVNGSKSTRTQQYLFKAPSKSDLSSKEKESNEAIKEELSESIKLAKEIRDDLESLKQKMLDKKTIGFQEKKLLEELMEKQKKIQKSVQKATRNNQEKNRLQEEFNPIDEAILEKQQQLEDLFEKIMSEEMKEMLSELEKLMDELNKEEIEKSLEKMDLSNADLEKELDRNLELFKALELEKKLADAIDKLDDLKKKQDALKENTEDKKADSEQLKKEQEKLNEEFKSLEKDLEEIKEKNEELEEPKKLEETDNLEEQIKEDMKKSAEKLGQKNKSKAGDSQKEASEKMEELSEKLNQMQLEMESQANAENLEDLRFLLENLIQLSFDQEDVMQNLKRLDPNDPNYVELAQEQKKLKDDAKIIEDSLFALSKRVVQLESIVNKEISAINYNMDQAIGDLGERQTAKAGNRQQLSMTSINNLALLLDEAIENMQSQMQMQSKGKCQKPGNGKPSPGSMKSMQQQLNKQLQDLKKAMEDGGKKPGGKKGSKPGMGKPGMSKELAQMAAKQASIRKAIEEMQEQIEGAGTGGSGQLKKLGELMEKTETDLVNKRISNETILRQQEILTRLLESEKAEKEREKEEKRESKEFVDEISRNPEQFLEYTKQKEKEIELLRTLPPTFNPFYKQKVSDYFKSIKQ